MDYIFRQKDPSSQMTRPCSKIPTIYLSPNNTPPTKKEVTIISESTSSQRDLIKIPMFDFDDTNEEILENNDKILFSLRISRLKFSNKVLIQNASQQRFVN